MFDPVGKVLSNVFFIRQHYVNESIQDLELSNGLYYYVLLIDHENKLTQKQIIEYAKVERSTVNKALNKLIELEYIKVEINHSDKRHKYYSINENKNEQIIELKKRIDTIDQMMYQGLDTKQINTFEKLLYECEQNLERGNKSE